MRTATRFRYRAADAGGGVLRGVLEARDAEDARARLATRGLYPLEISLRRTGNQRAMDPREMALGFTALASLLEAGLPLARALAALEDAAPVAWAETLPGLRSAVREGTSFASALETAPVTLPPAVLGLVRAGEGAGDLAGAVRRAASLTEASAETRAALLNALAYPAILAVAGFGSLALLVGVVLPRFAGILADLGLALPPATRLLLAATEVARVSALPVGLGAAFALVAWWKWRSTPEGQERWHALLLTVPGIGSIRMALATSRVAHILAGLLATGVPMGRALTLAGEAAGDAAVGRRITRALERITAGESPSRALGDQGALSPTAVRLARAGEESGRLAELLHHAARLEAERATRAVGGLVRVMEPALVIGFGAVVAFAAAALLQAVYAVRPMP